MGTGFRESEAHKALKIKAKGFLERLGCENIVTEKTLGRRREGGTGYIVVDVAGEIDGKLIVVECGGVAKFGKLRRLKIWKRVGGITSVFIFPYGEEEPYLWVEDIKICPTCGHKL